MVSRTRLVLLPVAMLAMACLAASVTLEPRPAEAATIQPASRPFMGWTTWDTYRCNPTQEIVEAQAKAMHDRLGGHGYQYVNVDSICSWRIDGFGRWIYDSPQFPQGIAPVAAYVHGLGLKLGVYVNPGIPIAAVEQNTPIEGTPYHARDIIYGTTVYANEFQNTYKVDYSKPGAQRFIDSWADLLASWGADLVKLDAVAPGSDTTSYDTRADVQAWSAALARSGRHQWLELSWHLDARYASFWRQYANGWRTDDDIDCYGSGGCAALTAWANPAGYVRDTILARFFDEPQWVPYDRPGGWSDLDSLLVGNGQLDGLKTVERQTAVTLWAIAGSSFYTGDDLTNLDGDGLRLLTNDEVIAVDQGGVAGAPLVTNSDQQVWRAREPDGSYAVALFNLGAHPAPVDVSWSDLGFRGAARVRDLWTHSSIGVIDRGFSTVVGSHASRLLRVWPISDAGFRPPSPEPGPPATFYEAESPANTLSGGATVVSCGGCSGGLKVGNLYHGGTVVFNGVTAPAAGDYSLTLGYAGGDERTGYVSVNGGSEDLVGFFPKTGGWDTVGTYTIRVSLHSGANTISFGSHASTYSPDLDRIAIAPVTEEK